MTRKIEIGLSGEKVNRRKLLAKWVAIAAGTLVTTLLPWKAEAADGDPIVIGQSNAGLTTTKLEADVAEVGEGGALDVSNPHAHDGSGGAPVAVSGRGFVGVSGTSNGVKTYDGPGMEPAGVAGIYEASNVPGWGVAVVGMVFGTAPAPDGGPTLSDNGIGVAGYSRTDEEDMPHPDPNEMTGIGVLGLGSRKGVLAMSKNGRALDVRGKAYFSSSGYDIIPEGSTKKIVSGVVLDENALVLVTLQSSAGRNVYVSYAQKISDTSFEVRLSRQTRQEAKFAWFIIN